jgi:hypothetical protein
VRNLQLPHSSPRSHAPNDYPSLLLSLRPVHDAVQLFMERNIWRRRPPVPWKVLRDIWGNSRTLEVSAELLPDPDEVELADIHSRGRAVRKWTLLALAERIIVSVFPRIPDLIAGHLIWVYGGLCVVSRTYCEAKSPQFIELFSNLI